MNGSLDPQVGLPGGPGPHREAAAVHRPRAGQVTACRECGADFDRAPATPRVCEACMPAFTERLVREGTPIGRYAWPEEVLGDDPAHRRIKRLALLTTKAPSRERPARGTAPPTPQERRREADRAAAALDAALQGEDIGRLRYWAGVTMLDGHVNGATGEGGVWAAASRVVARERPPKLGRAASRPGRPGRRPAVMRERGEEQGHETFLSPVPAHVEKPERLADVVLVEAKERLTDMARLSRWCSGRQCVPISNLELEARVQLSEIVQKGDDREPRFGDGAEIGIARGPLEPAAEDRIAKQRLEARRDVGAVVFETMEAIGRFVLSPGVHSHVPEPIPMPFIVHPVARVGSDVHEFLRH